MVFSLSVSMIRIAASNNLKTAIEHLQVEDFIRNPYVVSFKYHLPKQLVNEAVQRNHLIYTRLHLHAKMEHPELADLIVNQDALLAVHVPLNIFKFEYLVKMTQNITGCVRLYSMLKASKSWLKRFMELVAQNAKTLLTVLSLKELTPQFIFEAFLSYRLKSEAEALPLV